MLFPPARAPRWSLLPSQPQLRPGEMEFHFETRVRAARGPALGMLSSRGAAELLLALRWPRAPGLARECAPPPRAFPSAPAELPEGRAGAAPRASAPALRRPARRRILLLFLSSLKEAKLVLPSVGATHGSASPSRGPANESRRPEDHRRGLFPITLCLKWRRG